MMITLSGHPIAEMKFSAVYGFHLTKDYGIEFSVDFLATAGPPGVPMPTIIQAMQAIVWLEGSGEAMEVGTALPERPTLFEAGVGNTYPALYRLGIPAAQMARIERLRDGRSLRFRLALDFAIGHSAARPVVLVDARIGVNVVCHVSQSDWLDVLNESGYRRASLGEVNSPPPRAQDEDYAARYLQRARILMLRGHFFESVSACRHALLELTNKLGDLSELEGALTLQRGDQSAMTPRQRELAIRGAALDYAAQAHHVLNERARDPLDRSSAILMIDITAAILRHESEAL